MYKSSTQNFSVRPEFLASDHFTTQSCTVTNAMGATVDGRKIVKGGTVFPANDATAVGIIVHDVDVTDGDQPAAYIDHGIVYSNRLPAAVEAAAKAVLPGILYRTYAGPAAPVEELPVVPNLGLESIAIGSLTLVPAFDGDTLEYAAATTNAKDKITVVASDLAEDLSILNGVTPVANGADATWSSGANTVTVSYNVGIATVTYEIVVTKS